MTNLRLLSHILKADEKKNKKKQKERDDEGRDQSMASCESRSPVPCAGYPRKEKR